MPRRRTRRSLVALLWNLEWDDNRISCCVYRGAGGLELRLESGARTLLAEPFQIQPRSLARVNALKRSLERRGWRDLLAD